jgi:mRNA-degrading endonuclease YafQ of YafQ-DinJ toxin-antitoxin module
MQIIYSQQFVKDFKRIDLQTQRKAREKEIIFRENPFDNRLRTHKLSGRLDGSWSFSVNYDCRIVFEFKTGKTAIFHTIGGHSIYN